MSLVVLSLPVQQPVQHGQTGHVTATACGCVPLTGKHAPAVLPPLHVSERCQDQPPALVLASKHMLRVLAGLAGGVCGQGQGRGWREGRV